VCCVTNQDDSIVKPFIDHFLTESKRSASSNIDIVKRKGDVAIRESFSELVLTASDHGQQMLPEQCNWVHGVVPVRLRKLMALKSIRNGAKPSSSCGFPGWPAEMPACRPEEVIDSVWRETKFPKREVRVGFLRWQMDLQVCCYPGFRIRVQANFLLNVCGRFEKMLANHAFLPVCTDEP
jgi:hypothetical protein